MSFDFSAIKPAKNRELKELNVKKEGSLNLDFNLPQWLSGKESAFNAGAAGDMGSIPGSGKSPEGRHGDPFQYSCLESLMDRRACLAIYSPWGTESDTTEAT